MKMWHPVIEREVDAGPRLARVLRKSGWIPLAEHLRAQVVQVGETVVSKQELEDLAEPEDSPASAWHPETEE